MWPVHQTDSRNGELEIDLYWIDIDVIDSVVVIKQVQVVDKFQVIGYKLVIT